MLMLQIAKNVEWSFFKRLKSMVREYAINIDGIIVCGDLNCQIDVNNSSDKIINVLKLLWKIYLFLIVGNQVVNHVLKV